MSGEMQTPSHDPMAFTVDELPVATMVEEAGRIVEVNGAMLALLGVSESGELIGKSVGDFLSIQAENGTQPSVMPGPENRPFGWRQGTTVPSTGGSLDLWVRTGSKGTRRLITAIPSAEVVAPSTYLADVASMSARQAISRAFADLAHELRAPLNAVIGFAEMLQMKLSDSSDKIATGYVDNILTACQHITDVVDAGLELGVLNSDARTLQETTIEPARVFEHGVDILSSELAAKQIKAVVSVDRAPAKCLIYADALRLRQALLNLLSNAIKYGPANSTISLTFLVDGEGFSVFRIEDEGKSLSEEELKMAMVPFGRTKAALKSGEKGTGLGLPIVSAIAEAHGGEFILENRKDGKGVSAAIRLPRYRLVLEPNLFNRGHVDH